MTDISATCLRTGCSNPVPRSPQNRLYCSKPCKNVVNNQRDYARRREIVKASVRRYQLSERGQDMTLMRRYSITLAEREAMRESQGGKCVFCSRTDLYVDHDHFNGRFRGLLCMQHNGLLGHLGDGDPERANTFLNYLGLEPTRRVERP